MAGRTAPKLLSGDADGAVFALPGNRGSRCTFSERGVLAPCLACDEPTEGRVLAHPDGRPVYALCPTCQRAPRGFSKAEGRLRRAARAAEGGG